MRSKEQGSPLNPLPRPYMQKLQSLLGRGDQEETITMEEFGGAAQKRWSNKVDLRNQAVFQTLIREQGSRRDIIRTNGVMMPHAGDWLNSIPSKVYNLKIRSREFIPPVKFRLGMPIYRTVGPCPSCDDVSDIMGDHALNCKRGGGERTARHNHLRDILTALATAAHLNPQHEEQNLIPGSGRRPADVMIPQWQGGKDVAYDVTVINNLRQDLAVRQVEDPRNALEKARRTKNDNYLQDCLKEDIAFVPLPVEVTGAWEDRAVKEVDKIARALAKQQGQEEAQIRSHTFQRLSVALHKANAAIWLAECPDRTSPEVDGSP